MSGHHPLLLATPTICAYYPRVEIRRIDRFRAYLGGSVKGRPPRDFPSRARLTASSSNLSPWRQDSSFSALSVLEITVSLSKIINYLRCL